MEVRNGEEETLMCENAKSVVLLYSQRMPQEGVSSHFRCPMCVIAHHHSLMTTHGIRADDDFQTRVCTVKIEGILTTQKL